MALKEHASWLDTYLAENRRIVGTPYIYLEEKTVLLALPEMKSEDVAIFANEKSGLRL